MASEASKIQAEKQEQDRALLAALALAACSDIEQELQQAPNANDIPAAVTSALDKLVDVLVEAAQASFTRARQRMFEGFLEAVNKDPTLYNYVNGNIHEILTQADQLPAGTGLALRAAWENDARDFVKTMIEYVLGKLQRAPSKDSKGILIDVGLIGNVFLLASLIDTFTHNAYIQGLQYAGQHDAIKEILLGYEYVSMRDTRVRPRHKLEDGQFAYLGDVPKLKEFVKLLHDWGCRCTLVAIFGIPGTPPQLI